MAFDYEPRLTKAVFEEYKRKEADLVKRCQSGEFSDGILNIQLQWLSEWLHEKMAPGDRRIFTNTIGLRAFLVPLLGFDQTNFVIGHEMAHAEMAEALGYEVSYGVYVMKDEQCGIGFRPFCSFKGNITPEDWKFIHQAPSELSDYDRLAGEMIE